MSNSCPAAAAIAALPVAAPQAAADAVNPAFATNAQIRKCDYLDWSTAPLGQVVKGRLNGKVAVVTGASAGMGAVTARRLAAEGAKVVLFARRQDNLAQICNAIRAAGGEAIYLVGDVTKEEDNQKLVQFAVSQYGGLHIAFNNAGIMRGIGQKPWEYGVNTFNELMSVHTVSIFYAIKYQSLIISQSGGGVIINNSSIAAFRGKSPGIALYAASKAWVNSYTHCVTNDLAKIGVRINTICPGITLTDVSGHGEQGFNNLETLGKAKNLIGRPIKTEEIAAAVAYLASDEAKGITGMDFTIDGGNMTQ